jgi:hypothetical protein
VIGPLTARADAMWRSEQVVRQAYGNASSSPTLATGVGLDYVRGTGFGITVEGRYTRLLEAPPDLIFFAEDQVQVAVGGRFGFLSQRLMLQLFGAYDFAFSEMMARPTLSLRMSDHVQLEAGALFVEGSTPPPENVFESIVYEGSLGSYFDGNDCVTFAVTFIK